MLITIDLRTGSDLFPDSYLSILMFSISFGLVGNRNNESIT